MWLERLGDFISWLQCHLGFHAWYVLESQAPYGLYGSRQDFHRCAVCGKRQRVILEWEQRTDEDSGGSSTPQGAK